MIWENGINRMKKKDALKDVRYKGTVMFRWAFWKRSSNIMESEMFISRFEQREMMMKQKEN